MARLPKGPKQVTTLNHEADARRNIPTAEMADLAAMQEEMGPLPPAAYPRARPLAEGEVRERDEDLDPQIIWNGARIRLTKDQVAQLAETGEIEIGDAQLVWRGKDRQDWSDLIVTAPPLYIQEKVHPKAIIDDLVRQSKIAREDASDAPDLFADFNGLSDPMARTEFYQHDQHWSNRMILGDSLQVMASLAEREAMKGKVQAIFFDPPYGIKFGSNWQVSTQSTKVSDGAVSELSREPEQVKAFRDTWKDGIHSYLTYLRDRLTVARELLTDSGSIFVQISDENVHRVRSVMDEVFGSENFHAQINFKSSSPLGQFGLAKVYDYILWYAKNIDAMKFRPLFKTRDIGEDREWRFISDKTATKGYRKINEDEFGTLSSHNDVFRRYKMTSAGYTPSCTFGFTLNGQSIQKSKYSWKTNRVGMERLNKADRLFMLAGSPYFKTFFHESSTVKFDNSWSDQPAAEARSYVVQTASKFVERCVLMTTDPGDIVLDPTCGSGTTAYVAEQWGRRWIVVDTSRVALALARARVMGARFPWYYLLDSVDGKKKESQITGKILSDKSVFGDVRQGFIYERVPRVTLGDIARNSEIDLIWDKWQGIIEPLRLQFNELNNEQWEEWEFPHELNLAWPNNVSAIHKAWWDARIARQQEMDASIARAADVEYLYDKPYADPSRVRVAGPFTVENLSPHRIVPADAEELLNDTARSAKPKKRGPLSSSETDFAAMVIEHLQTAGVHQTDKADRISFTSVTPYAGRGYIGAEGVFMEGEGADAVERRAAIFIGPEFGTLSRVDLTAAAREAAESRFDVLIAVSFAFDAHASELTRLGPLPILKAKMNPDLHMAGELKNTGKGNLFTVFGEPDIDIVEEADGRIAVRVNGVDIYDPNTGEVRSSDVKGIAAWFIDTAYNEESFFVRHAYFLGANEPYKQLRNALKAEIDEEAWATLNRATSRPFARPESGRIAVKVINHFGDEVMKVFGV